MTLRVTSLLTRYKGIVYRAHDPRWAYEPTSGDGAKKYGGRFNPPGMAALYAAESVNTAVLESQQGFAYKGLQPITLCSYDIDCDDLLDLTDAKVQKALPIASDSVLKCGWESLMLRGERVPSHQLAHDLFDAGIAAIRVPSFAVGAAASDINVVLWRWSNKRPHKVNVIDDLKRLQKI